MTAKQIGVLQWQILSLSLSLSICVPGRKQKFGKKTQ
jgi:hypothetical protein